MMLFSAVNFDEVARVGGESFRSVVNDITFLLCKESASMELQVFELSPEIDLEMYNKEIELMIAL